MLKGLVGVKLLKQLHLDNVMIGSILYCTCSRIPQRRMSRVNRGSVGLSGQRGNDRCKRRKSPYRSLKAEMACTVDA